jgi:hypothetical protein
LIPGRGRFRARSSVSRILAVRGRDHGVGTTIGLRRQAAWTGNLLKYQATSICPSHIYAFFARLQSVKVML